MTEIYTLSADGIVVAVDLGLGQIAKLEVTFEGRKLSPFHTVPWIDDPEQDFPEGTDPHLTRMSVDFFCAPFAKSDVEDTPLHGWPANTSWSLLEEEQFDGGKRASFLLSRKVMGGDVIKTLTVRDGHPFLYQSHKFIGAGGAIPVAYHPMVSLPSGGMISVSSKLRAETMNTPLETEPACGKSELAYPATSRDLRSFPDSKGSQVDLLKYPIAETNEDLVMLIENPENALGWTAVARQSEGDMVITLKSPSTLPSTILWYSNGGRFYSPWNGRHKGVLGVEEACTNLAYGHRASIEDNPISNAGIPTAIDLRQKTEIRYILGTCTIGVGEAEVENVEMASGYLSVMFSGGKTKRIPIDEQFLS